MALKLPKRHFGEHLNAGALPMEKGEGEIAKKSKTVLF
jgi:hypothetical protein